MRPTVDEFVHGRTGWRSEAHGFSIEVRWGGFSVEEPEGHWWWSVCIAKDQLKASDWYRQLLAQRRYWLSFVDSFEVHNTWRTMGASFEAFEYVKMCKRSVDQASAASVEKEARGFCLALLKEFPGRKVWDQTTKKYQPEAKEQEK